MAQAPRPDAPLYSAFLSYSRKDEAFAVRLHRRLEAFRLPHGLVAAGSDGAGLGPVFRDRDELTAAPDLTEAVRAALARSRVLVVVASPDAAASTWVGREIGLFRALRPDAPILTALVRGEPSEAFPPALVEPGADGRAPLPLASDFRPGGDGRLAFLKLVAGLAGVRLDDLVRREGQRRRRRFVLSAGAAAAVLAAGSALSWTALQNAAAAWTERGRTDAQIGYLLGPLREHAKAVGRIRLLEDITQSALRPLADRPSSDLTPRERLALAKALDEKAEDVERRGDFAGALRIAQQSEAITRPLLAQAPKDPDRLFAEAQNAYWIGLADWRLGRTAEAERRFRAYAELAGRYAARARPKDRVAGLEEAANAESNLGMFALEEIADLPRAQALFQSSLAKFQRAARLKPLDDELQRSIADGYAWIGDVARLRGDAAGALAARGSQTRILEAMLRQDPRDAQVREQLVAAELGMARVKEMAGRRADALAELQDAHERAAALAGEDPDNASFRRQKRAIELFRARILVDGPAPEASVLREAKSLVGDCSGDAAIGGSELLDFCRVVSARLMAASCRAAEAKGLLTPVRAELASHPARLTSRWRIDLRTETESADPGAAGACRRR